ncbi:15673_t:CDS:2, partial [Racocetra fulgida]
EAHKHYNEEAKAILWQSNRQIDLRTTGTYASASLRFFQDVTKVSRKAKDLSQEEDHWIKSAYMGALTWAELYEGIATELDFNEFYPNILAHGSIYWPIGADDVWLYLFQQEDAKLYQKKLDH